MDFRIEQARPEDAAAVAGLIRAVWDGMENKEWFVPDDEEFVKSILKPGQGFVLKVTCTGTGRMAGIMNLLTPGTGKANLGHDAGFSEEQLLKTAHVDSVAILPEYRGRHLQSSLLKAAEERLKAEGYRFMMCTVHPENYYSRDNMEKHGFETVCRKEKYGGRIRYIMMKELI